VFSHYHNRFVQALEAKDAELDSLLREKAAAAAREQKEGEGEHEEEGEHESRVSELQQAVLDQAAASEATEAEAAVLTLFLVLGLPAIHNIDVIGSLASSPRRLLA
jgi:hypothetical protein